MKKGFIFIETIIVVCVLTVALMSLYANYSKIMMNTKELNTYDTAEYNYKTYFLMQKLSSDVNDDECVIRNNTYEYSSFSDNKSLKICKLSSVSTKDYDDLSSILNIDAYVIDYIKNQDLTTSNDNLFLVEYKKEDKVNSVGTDKLYYTYISSLNY